MPSFSLFAKFWPCSLVSKSVKDDSRDGVVGGLELLNPALSSLCVSPPPAIFVSRAGVQLAEKGDQPTPIMDGSAAERGVGLNLKVWIKVRGEGG